MFVGLGHNVLEGERRHGKYGINRTADYNMEWKINSNAAI